MTTLSQRILTDTCRIYRKNFKIMAYPVFVSGQLYNKTSRAPAVFSLKSAHQTMAYSLQESVHWGEPYIFCWAPGVISWIAAMVDENSVHGGLLSSPVISQHFSATITTNLAEDAVAEMQKRGLKPDFARDYISRLPKWQPERIREAATFLQDTFYRVSGWNPYLLRENRIKSLQQRQISAAIEEQKKKGSTNYPVDKERMLLSLIKTGDQNGARKLLNEMLAAMFLFSQKLPLLRARAIEMMGYLTRAAIEDSPLMEPLIERNHQWMQKLIEARDFETLSHVLMLALDDFMEGIFAQGFNCYNPKASRVLDYLSRHYTSEIKLQDLANELGLSKFHVSHLVKAHTGKSILQHVMRLRIQKARQLLERTSMPCAQIAAETGFCDQSYFIKQFKKITGTTPVKHRHGRFVFSTT